MWFLEMKNDNLPTDLQLIKLRFVFKVYQGLPSTG